MEIEDRQYDIFNHLIYHSTDYEKEYFEDGDIESLITNTLKNKSLHVYVGGVRPAIKTETDDGKDC